MPILIIFLVAWISYNRELFIEGVLQGILFFPFFFGFSLERKGGGGMILLWHALEFLIE